MRIIIQRVTQASVSVDERLVSSIGHGMMILVGVENGDTDDDVSWLASKTAALRIFDDAQGIMNLPITAVGGQVLAISQFTLTASTRRGARPSYIRAARGPQAETLYLRYCELLAAALTAPTATPAAATPNTTPSDTFTENHGVPTESISPLMGAPDQGPVKRGIFGADMAVSLTNDGPVTIIIDSRLRE